MKFNVPDMSCGHCTAAITKAIKAQDTKAEVDCDLSSRTVSVETALDSQAISAAITDAGYASTEIAAA
ncbi:heavy-metal-associated domain-containing protein [Thalassovita aquimarina]|uniref:Heavy-metal-associated domain-containing protein n=1 Tax=Thalassovita aquimarina TaxID=2785917 RepID=A0ABS5HWY7_9RHOB|nr:heavy-metal-associated domain-containing protein [Thalassovita aquimarina]MBR9653483.1 heavy-metal-associated domain-containing protein [Thalassovita aquimarina]